MPTTRSKRGRRTGSRRPARRHLLAATSPPRTTSSPGRSGSSRPRTAAGTVHLIGPLLHGPVTPAEARARIERLRGAGPIAMNSVLCVEAHLLQLEGRLDEALELHERRGELVRALGMPMMQAL